jgi:hypothetical protein
MLTSRTACEDCLIAAARKVDYGKLDASAIIVNRLVRRTLPKLGMFGEWHDNAVFPRKDLSEDTFPGLFMISDEGKIRCYDFQDFGIL